MSVKSKLKQNYSRKGTGDDDAKNVEKILACNLTTPEFVKRKAMVIAGLKKQLLQKKELANGFAYKFYGTDAILDDLCQFIKTERICCDFFSYAISISGDKKEAWLSLTGPAGVKEFISTSLEF